MVRASYFTGSGNQPAPAQACEECGSEDLEIFALTALTFSTQNVEDELQIDLVHVDDASQGEYFWQEGGLTIRCSECKNEWKDPSLRVHYEIV